MLVLELLVDEMLVKAAVEERRSGLRLSLLG